MSNLATVTYANGVKQTLAYDAVDHLTNSSTSARSYSYRRAATGHIQSILEGSGRNLVYGYDNVWRLLSESVSADPGSRNGSVNYAVDPVGNRLSQTSTFTQIISGTFTYNANDQATGDTYDANGNVLASGPSTYVWDFRNRLKSFKTGAVTMVYDGDNNRVAKTVGGTTTGYLVDELSPTGYPQVVEELSGGAVVRTYTYGLERISQSQPVNSTWQTNWYGYDGEGHVRSLTDSSGTITDTYDYDAFGNVIASTGMTPNSYRYRGEQLDSDLGLYYLRARWYNPATGRFLSRDPLDTGNKYAYAGADPVNRIDPSGQDEFIDWIVENGPAIAVTTLTIAAGVAIWEHQHPSNYTFNPVGTNFVCIMGAMNSLLERAGVGKVTTTVIVVSPWHVCKPKRQLIDPIPPISPTKDDFSDVCDGLPINSVSKKDMPKIAAHIEMAQAQGYPFLLHYLGPGNPLTGPNPLPSNTY